MARLFCLMLHVLALTSIEWSQVCCDTTEEVTAINCNTSIAASSSNVTESGQNYTCPVWMVAYHVVSCNRTTIVCDNIKNRNRAVKCDAKPNWILLHCYCITEYDKNTSLLVTGLCPYTCISDLLKGDITLPQDKNATQIGSSICSGSKRKGQLCGHCENGYAPAVYSYTEKCVNCTDYKLNWLKYIGVAYGPQTLFFTVIVLTRTSVTSGRMVGFVTVSQMLASSVQNRFDTVEHNKRNDTFLYVLFPMIYGIWNLDFFRDIYQPFCLHPQQSMLAVIALDYTVALYPIALLVLTYAVIVGCDRFRSTRSCWIPLSQVSRSYHKLCDFRGSVVDAFASVLILSYVKILNTSIELLLRTPLVNLEGKVLTSVVYYNGSMSYFGRDHAPYAALSLLMLITFNFFPVVLLTFYPCKCFQNILNRYAPRHINLSFIHLSMDVFYRSYKNNNRYFAVLYIYVRIFSFILLEAILSPTYIAMISILFYLVAVVIGLAQPHKRQVHNIINSAMFALAGVLKTMEFTVYIALSVYPDDFRDWGRSIIVTLYFIPLLFGILVLMSRFIPKEALTTAIKRLKSKFGRVNYFYDEPAENDEYSHLVNVNQ